MDDKCPYAAILEVNEPWGVDKVELRLPHGDVRIRHTFRTDTASLCPSARLGCRSATIASNCGATRPLQ